MFAAVKACMMFAMAVGIFLPIHTYYRPMGWLLWLLMAMAWMGMWRQTYVRDKRSQTQGGRGFYAHDHLAYAVMMGLSVWSGSKTVLCVVALLTWPWQQGWNVEVQAFKTMQYRSTSSTQLEIWIPDLAVRTGMSVNDSQYLRKSRSGEGQRLKIKVATTPFAYVFSAYGFYYE